MRKRRMLFRGIRGTYGGGTSATEGDVWGKWLGARATQGGKRRIGWCAWTKNQNLALSSKGGERLGKQASKWFGRFEESAL